jgi:hypothetical protein
MIILKKELINGLKNNKIFGILVKSQVHSTQALNNI